MMMQVKASISQFFESNCQKAVFEDKGLRISTFFNMHLQYVLKYAYYTYLCMLHMQCFHSWLLHVLFFTLIWYLNYVWEVHKCYFMFKWICIVYSLCNVHFIQPTCSQDFLHHISYVYNFYLVCINAEQTTKRRLTNGCY